MLPHTPEAKRVAKSNAGENLLYLCALGQLPAIDSFSRAYGYPTQESLGESAGLLKDRDDDWRLRPTHGGQHWYNPPVICRRLRELDVAR